MAADSTRPARLTIKGLIMDYVTIKTGFWHDAEVMSWTPESKFFFLYLVTNPRASWCGIFEAPLRLMEAETGYTWETIRKLLAEMESLGKIVFSESTREIAIVNWMKHHKAEKSPNIIKAMAIEAGKVKNQNLISLVLGLSELLKLNPSETLPKPFRNPSETLPYNTNTNTNTNTKIESASASPLAPALVRHKFGKYKNVLLTDDQLAKLSADYQDADQAIEYLSDYRQMKGYKAKDDNLALRKWVFVAMREERLKLATLDSREKKLEGVEEFKTSTLPAFRPEMAAQAPTEEERAQIDIDELDDLFGGKRGSA
jgi:hypothetical protein